MVESVEEGRLNLAHTYAERNSTCSKVHVGSVIEVYNHSLIFGCNHGCSDCRKNGCRRVKLYGNASKEHRLPSDCDAVAEAMGCINIGRGAFRSALKVRCEACWSGQKRKCRHK